MQLHGRGTKRHRRASSLRTSSSPPIQGIRQLSAGYTSGSQTLTSTGTQSTAPDVITSEKGAPARRQIILNSAEPDS